MNADANIEIIAGERIMKRDRYTYYTVETER